jgi:hypothetical protein
MHRSESGVQLCIGLARLGRSVCWVSRVGADPSVPVVKTLRGESADAAGGSILNEPTGIMFGKTGPIPLCFHTAILPPLP